VLRVKYQRLTWHIDTAYGELCWLTSLQDRVASGWKQWLVVCVLSVTEWLASNVVTWILIRTYNFRTTSKIFPPLCIFSYGNPWHPFDEANFRNTDLLDSKLPVLKLKFFFLLLPSYHVFQLNRKDVHLSAHPVCLPQLLRHSTYTKQTVTTNITIFI